MFRIALLLALAVSGDARTRDRLASASFTAPPGGLADGQATRIFWNESTQQQNIVIHQPDHSKFTVVEHGYFFFDAIVEFDAQGSYGSFNTGSKYLTLYLKRSGNLVGVLYVRAISEGAKPTYVRLPQHKYGYHLNAGDEIYLTLYVTYGYFGSVSTYSGPRLRIIYKGHE